MCVPISVYLLGPTRNLLLGQRGGICQLLCTCIGYKQQNINGTATYGYVFLVLSV